MSIGWIDTSVHSSGDLQSSRKLTFERTDLYSDRYRPAWRISHTGVTSTGSFRQAFKNL